MVNPQLKVGDFINPELRIYELSQQSWGFYKSSTEDFITSKISATVPPYMRSTMAVSLPWRRSVNIRWQLATGTINILCCLFTFASVHWTQLAALRRVTLQPPLRGSTLAANILRIRLSWVARSVLQYRHLKVACMGKGMGKTEQPTKVRVCWTPLSARCGAAQAVQAGG